MIKKEKQLAKARQALRRAGEAVEFVGAITPVMWQQMQHDFDAIGRQFIPNVLEKVVSPQELSDPIGDKVHSPVAHLVHRYDNRVLWKIAPRCAVYCRFCFRKDFLGEQARPVSVQEIEAGLSYIAAHHHIDEVILSGGDPLSLSPKRLQWICQQLAEIASVKRLRVHTRVPIVAPEHYQSQIQALKASLKTVMVVVHINHAQEFNPLSDKALLAMREALFILASQTVLLKGVNDDAHTLARLMNGLLARGVQPYYLHHLDLARGTSHFRLSIDEGKAIYRALRKLVSGVACPRYIVEIPAGGGKMPVMELDDKTLAALAKWGIY